MPTTDHSRLLPLQDSCNKRGDRDKDEKMKTMIRTFMNIVKVLTNLHFSLLAATRLNVANCRPTPSTLSLLLNFFTITTTIILLVIDAGDGKLGNRCD